MKIRCPRCKNTIAEYTAGCWVVRRLGREWVGRELISVRCEKCGAVWAPSDSLPVLGGTDNGLEMDSKAQASG